MGSLSDIEQGEIVPDLFRHACLMGLEGLVSKHRDSAYRGDRFRHRIKNQESGTSRLQPRAGSILDGTIPSARVGLAAARYNPRVAREALVLHASGLKNAGPLALSVRFNPRCRTQNGWSSMTENHSTKGQSTKKHSQRHGGTPLVVACAVAAFGVLGLLFASVRGTSQRCNQRRQRPTPPRVKRRARLAQPSRQPSLSQQLNHCRPARSPLIR
jgi:hypothetical protein